MLAMKYCRFCLTVKKEENSNYFQKVATDLLVLIQTFLTTYEVYLLHFALYTSRGIDYENKFILSLGPINRPVFINATICGQPEETTISRSLLWSLLSNTTIKSLKIYIDLTPNVFKETVLIIKKIAEMVQDGYLDNIEEFFIKISVDFTGLVGVTKSLYTPYHYTKSSKQLGEALAMKQLASLKRFGIEIDDTIWDMAYPRTNSIVSNLRQYSPLLQKIEGFSHFSEPDFINFYDMKNINWKSLVELDLGALIHSRCRLNQFMIPLSDHDESLHSVVQGLVATLSSENFPMLTTLKISATCVEQMFTIVEALVTSIKTGHFSAHKNIKTLLLDIDRIEPRMHLEVQDSYQNLGSHKGIMLFPSLNNFICNNWLPSAHLFKVIAFNNCCSSNNKLVVSPGMEDGAFCTYLGSYVSSTIPPTLILKPREYNRPGVVQCINSTELSRLMFRTDIDSLRLSSEYPTAADNTYDSESCDDIVSRALYRSVLCDRLNNISILGFTINYLYYMYTLDNFHSFKVSGNNKSQMNQSVQHLAAHCPLLQCIKLDIAPVAYAKDPHETIINSFFAALNECMILLDRNIHVEITVGDDVNYRELLETKNSNKNEMNRVNVSLVLDVNRIVIV